MTLAGLGERRLRALGDGLQRRQDAVRGVQWLFVVVYYILLIVPAAYSPDKGAGIGQLAAWAEVLFWAVWWPSVLVVTLLFGQFWCGVLCPDGTVTEFASQHGLEGKIPAWVRKPGWAMIAIALTTVYEHANNAYSSPRAILLSLGLTSLLALVCGLLIGRSKRVWCRYLCPVGSVFSLLARCAVLQFKVDRALWDAAPKPLPRAVDCPLLLDVRRLRSNEKCSMCGRCSGHRGAVQLGARWPGSEIVAMSPSDPRGADVAGVLLVLVGIFFAAAHGAELASSLSSFDVPALASVPQWVAVIVGAVLLALSLWGGLCLIAWGRIGTAKHLCYSLIPVGAGGLAVMALDYSLAVARRWGMDVFAFVHAFQAAMLAGTALWSAILGVVILRRHQPAWLPARYVGHLALVGGMVVLYGQGSVF
ncbi:MAG: 4Fe-4S binding protein [Actinomycetota bacterium]